MQLKTRTDCRRARHRRVRRRIRGTEARPRLAVYRSATSLQAQLIDDEKGETLVAARSGGSKSVVAASELGVRIAELAGARGIARAVVDRGGFRFHGRVKAVVDAAVAAGLSIGDVAPADAGKEDK